MRVRRAAEMAALGVALATFGYLGWDSALWDARLQLLLHLFALAALGALVLLVDRGTALPRTPVDRPLLLLLVALGSAVVLAQNHGLAARALLSVLATAAMLPIAILAVRHRPAAAALVVAVPVLLGAVGALALMLPRRVAWYAAGGPGLVPPARLGGDGSPFGPVTVVPFVILAALAVTLLLRPGAVRRRLQVGLLGVGVPLTAFSGSRAAWFAIAVAALALVVPHLGGLRRRRIPARPRPARLVAVGLAAVALVAVALTALPRLTEVSSVVYRGFLWRDSLAALDGHALLGIGPGTMQYARQAAAPPLSFPARQPHSHNLALGVLGDAGLVGILAATLLVVTFFWVAGPWRQRRPAGRAAAAVLLGFMVAGLFDDLTFLPGFNLLVILLAAVALVGADLVRWQPVRPRLVGRAALAVGAAAAVVVMLLGDLSAVLHRSGVDAFARGDPVTARSLLVRAERLDPWHPGNPRALAVAASWLDDGAGARRAAEQAVAHNRGDGPSWTNLALACARLRDDSCAVAAAREAVTRAQAPGLELINAALLLERAGQAAESDAAYALSLLTNRSTALDHAWPRTVELDASAIVELGGEAVSMNLLLGRRAQGQPIDPAAFDDPATRALASAMIGDRAGAEAALDEAERLRAGSTVTWDVAALLATHWGRDPGRALRLAELLRGEPIATEGNRLLPRIRDIGDFRTYPADGYAAWAERLLLDPPWPWAVDPLLPERAHAGFPIQAAAVPECAVMAPARPLDGCAARRRG